MRDNMEIAAVSANFTGQGTTCDPTCRYDETPTTAIIDSVEYSGVADPCEPVLVDIDATFVEEPGVWALTFWHQEMIPSACLEAVGLVVEQEVPAMFQTITNGGCSPEYGRLDLDLSACEAICPSE